MKTRQQSGFTLVELVIACVLVAVVTTLAVPTFSRAVAKNRRVAVANDYFIGFQLARSEAVKRNLPVTMCPSDDSAQCLGRGEWADGYIIFSDVNANAVVDPADEMVRVYNGVPLEQTTVNSPMTEVIFSADGFPQDALGAPLAGVVRMCDDEGLDEARGIQLALSGRARLTRDKNVILRCP